MPKDDDVVSLEPIEATWGNQVVRDKLVQRATNAADLASGWPAPQDGETVWQQDTDQLWVWNGTVWVEVVFGPSLWIAKTGGTMTGTLVANAGANAATDLDLSSSDYSESGAPPFRAWKDPGGFVHLQGRIDNVDPGTIGDTTVFTLPVGYRPPSSVNAVVFDQGTGPAIRCYIQAGTGLVTLPDGGPGYWWDFNGVTFYAGW